MGRRHRIAAQRRLHAETVAEVRTAINAWGTPQEGRIVGPPSTWGVNPHTGREGGVRTNVTLDRRTGRMSPKVPARWSHGLAVETRQEVLQRKPKPPKPPKARKPEPVGESTGFLNYATDERFGFADKRPEPKVRIMEAVIDGQTVSVTVYRAGKARAKVARPAYVTDLARGYLESV